jgi:uncharacterized protein YutD
MKIDIQPSIDDDGRDQKIIIQQFMKELCRRDEVYFVNREKNQKHKKVLELKEDAEETTDENNSNKEATTTTAEKEEEATTPTTED